MEKAFNFNTGKPHVVGFDWFNNFGATDVKIDESVFEEKFISKMLYWDS